MRYSIIENLTHRAQSEVNSFAVIQCHGILE
jgi:hypothetical protein